MTIIPIILFTISALRTKSKSDDTTGILLYHISMLLLIVIQIKDK